MAFPPPGSTPIPRMGPPPIFRGAPPFLMPQAQPGLLGPGVPVPMAPMTSGVRLPLQPPLGLPPITMGMPGQPLPIQHTISAPPMGLEPPKNFQPKVPVISAADMKVATTVFVGNISDKATDTLVRQILLRCGRIEGWKRVQDASGKLQAFGFCEYGEPDSTLRALRLLHDFKLGEKNLVVKVDAKTRKDLLKYITRKKRTAKNLPLDDEEIEKEVAEIEDRDGGIAALRQEVDGDMKDEDARIIGAIKSLAKENIEILSSSRSSKDEQLERDVKDALLSMAKQSGKIDPDSTLDDMDMEDDMKTLVSDEIKKFRQSYQRDEEKKQARRDKVSRERERDRSREHGREREKDREREREKDRGKDKDRDRRDSPRREREREKERGKSPLRERSKSPRRRSRSPRRSRSRSPRRSPRHSPVRSRSSPVRSHSQERAEREKQRERERQRQKDALAREEEEYEERQRAKKQRERERVYRDKYEVWMSRERRKAKEYEKDYEKEGEKRDEMEREKRHLAEFLEDYDDTKDDQRYYKGSAYARRRRERELEIEEDERDRHREKEEIEALRLQVMERQHQERRATEHLRGEEESEMEESSSPEDSPQRRGEEEEEEDMPVKEIEEDIPLTKPGYPVPAAYPPIQVQSAPVVMAPEIKDHPKEKSVGDGITIRTFEPLRPEEAVGRDEEDGEGEDTPSSGSPQSAPKLAFGLMKKSSSSGGNPSLPPPKKAKLEHVFSTEEDEAEWKPKKKLIPIEYSEEEQQAVGRTNKTAQVPSKSQRGSAKQPHEDRKITTEERKKMVQNLVNSIPTTKDEVFAYELKWEQIDKTLMEKRVGPWINKKIVEYVGEEEPSLRDFICNKLACNIAPGALLGDIAVVLDDEAEVFVVKLWRLLIYETEAKHLGIAKNY